MAYTLQDILGGGIPSGLLSQDQMAQANRSAEAQGLLALGLNLLAGSQGVGRKPALGQVLGQAGTAGLQAYQGAQQDAMKRVLQEIQVKDMMAKREREKKLQEAIQNAYISRPTLQGILDTQTNIDPALLEGMSAQQVIAEAPKTERIFDRSKALEALAQYGGMEGLSAYLTATKPTESPETIRTLEILAKRPELAQLQANLKRAGASTINVGAPGKEFVGKLADQLTTFRNTGMAARSTLPTLEAMSDLLDAGVKTGFGQETMLGLQRAGQLFNPDFKVKETAGQEAFLAGSNEVILPQVKKLGVNPTDTDLKFIERGSASLSKSVEGNKLMLDATKIKFQRDALLQEFASDWQARNAALINSDPVTADAKFNQDLIALTKSHPLYTQAPAVLRERYQKITGSKAAATQPLLQQGGFVK